MLIRPRNVPLHLTETFLDDLSAAQDLAALRRLIADAAHELRFSHFAMITHEDLRVPRPGQVDIRSYPDAISERIIGEMQFRRDPVMRGCVFAERAFLWSQLAEIIKLDRRDRSTLEFGARHGLLEGITVPCGKYGCTLGSLTFAGNIASGRAERCLPLAQFIGIFSFKRARFLAGDPVEPMSTVRLHPRPRDCVVLVGRGYSNKQIARALGLAPRTVDRYLTDARRLYGVSDRTELVIAAVLAGEVGLSELKDRQP